MEWMFFFFPILVEVLGDVEHHRHLCEQGSLFGNTESLVLIETSGV